MFLRTYLMCTFLIFLNELLPLLLGWFLKKKKEYQNVTYNIILLGPREMTNGKNKSIVKQQIMTS